jgi:predicted deacylase
VDAEPSRFPPLAPFPDAAALPAWPEDVGTLPPGRYVAEVPVARMLNGADLAIAIHVARGDGGPGPSLGLLAGIHGDEVGGVRCVREALAALPLERLRGTVVAVPVANPLAWAAQQRASPERLPDQTNLARVFGAGDGGSLTRRIAAALERTFYRAITHLIDYHSYGHDTAVRLMLYRTGQSAAALETSAAMARAFGLGVLRGVVGGQGTTSAYAADHGIPCCVAEMGGTNLSRLAEEYFTRLGADGARRVMAALDMLDDAPPGPDRQLVVERAITIAPSTSGYYLPEHDLEDLADPGLPNGIPVAAGERLGQLFDAYSLRLAEELVAPEDGRLIALVRGGPHQVGGPSITLARGRLA